MTLSESQDFLFGFISNLGHSMVGLVLLYAGRTLLLEPGLDAAFSFSVRFHVMVT